jgi:signal transduction histidine kinase
MFRVIGCITQQHDLRLVILAAVLCLFACITTMSMIGRARVSTARMRLLWLGAAGVVAGCGIWGTHFVAMLAFQPGIPVGYDEGLTILSVVIAAGLCSLGFAWALRPGQALLGGALTGAAISIMHYVGMSAVRVPADAVWDASYVTASVLIGVVLTALAMHFTLRNYKIYSYAIGALLFTLAIVGMHFTAMTAVTFVPNPTVMVPNALLNPTALAFVVAAGAILIVALGLTGALVDFHLGQRASNEAHRLREHIHELEMTKQRLEQTSADLTEALAAASAANTAKSQFLAAMSHELRTPLNAILGFSEMLSRQSYGPLAERYRDYVQDILASGAHLLSLINDVLDISRLDTGDAKLDERVFEIGDVIDEAVRMIAGEACIADISLHIEIGDSLPSVRADQRRIRQVLLNLLYNAVKFTPSGGSIKVSANRRHDSLAIAVTDTGIGIAEKDIPKALERFGQVDSRLSRKYVGVGLGLPLAKQLMELHGGTLKLASTIEVGTTITVTLPSGRLVAARAAA